MKGELIFLKTIELKEHHGKATIYIRDDILNEYKGKKLQVELYLHILRY